MALDPKFRALLEMPGMQLGRPPPEVTPPMMREAAKAMAPQIPSPPLNAVENIQIPGGAGTLGVRLYYPSADRPLPVILYIHGGGWALCDLDSHDLLCRTLALSSGCAVASIDYRLAPECKFPGPIDDCYSALSYLAANGAKHGLDATRIAIAGDSAGANLAVAVTMLARDRGGPKILHQALICPVLDAACDTRSMHDLATGYMLSRELMQWFWECYLASPADGANPLASPASAKNVAALPPATVVTAEFDILKDEGEAYADRLREAGVSAISRCYPGMIHDFVVFPFVTEVADRCLADVAQDLALALRGAGAQRPNANVEAAKRLYAAALTGDWTTVETLISKDLTIVEASSLPFAGTYVGLEGLQALFVKVGGMLEMRDIRFKPMAAVGDTVIAPIELVVDDRGTLVLVPVVETLRFESGRVVELTPYYFDAAQVTALVARHG